VFEIDRSELERLTKIVLANSVVDMDYEYAQNLAYDVLSTFNIEVREND
jgi:hypothetical protein